MKIITWNVNSLKTRLDHVRTLINKVKPDVLMMQELKGLDFPADTFTELGYQSLAVGQKAYNGVAIVSKHPITEIQNMLGGETEDAQARYLEVEINGKRLINIYLPNGNPVDTEKFTYKLRWMERLYHRLKVLREERVEFIIGGDFNVIPEPRDCYDPSAWIGDALFRIETRQAWRKFLNLGLTDALRVNNIAPQTYTFWDYQAGAWPQNKGIRIDHFLLSPAYADCMKSCIVDIDPRGWDKPSDHTPVILEIAA